MPSPYAFEALRQRLADRLRHDEVISPIDPRSLLLGRWWGGAPWPEGLVAGVLEARQGYRFRPENLALALWLRERPQGRRVVDLGAGSGSLAMLCAYLSGAERVVAVERQAQVAERLARTLEAHALASVALVEGDARESSTVADILRHLGGPADLVVMNPPFFEPGWGRESRHEETHLSTHAMYGDVGDFLATGVQVLEPGGALLVVFDAQRLHTVLGAASAHGLDLQGLRWIPDRRTGAPFRCWIALGRDGAPLTRVG